jgi:dienelactone hydrolase
MVERLQTTLTTRPNVTFLTHENGDHAFDNDDFHLYDETSSREAWEQTVGWLAENLPA